MRTDSLFEQKNIGRMFLRIAIPGAIGMLASAIYQLVDGMFVNAYLGSEAFSAVNLVFPFVIIIYAISDLIGVGSAVIIAIKLGEGKKEEANGIFSASVLLIFIADLILGLLTFFTADSILSLMKASPSLHSLASQYLKVYALTLPLTGYIFAMDNYLRINGMVKTSLAINVSMSLSIVLLEYLFLGVLDLPIWASALASCLGFSIFTIVSFVPFFGRRSTLRFRKPLFRVNLEFQILRNGLPAFLGNISGRITAVIFNFLLLSEGGEDAVSTYGVLMYIDGFVQPLLYGMCDSVQPCIGYNYGAGRKDRVRKVARLCYLSSIAICLLSSVLLFLLPGPISNLFVSSGGEGLKEMAKNATFIFAFTYLTRWMSYSTQSLFQAVEKPLPAVVLSIGYSLIFPLIGIPCFYGLGLTGFWLNVPVSSLLSGILGAVLLAIYRKSMKEDEKDRNDAPKDS